MVIALAVVCTAGAQGTSEAILGYTANASGFATGTAGWTFQTTTSLTATELGCFTNVFFNNAAVSTIQVGLWAPDGSLLASNSITPASSLLDQSRYESIEPVLLTPNQVYHIGIFNPGGNLGLEVAGVSSGGTVSLASLISLRGTALGSGGFTSPLEMPGPDASIYAGPNFLYRWVPEPSSSLLLGLGAGLWFARRFFRCS